MKDEEKKIYIKIETQGSQSFDLVALGDIFNGLDSLIREFYDISNISGDFNLKVDKVEEGSVLLSLCAEIITKLPFDKINDFYNFLLISSPDLYSKVLSFFNDVKNVHKNINDYFNAFPLDKDVLIVLFSVFVTKMIDKASMYKKDAIVPENEKKVMPQSYALKLHNMVLTKRFKKIVLPIGEDKIRSIKFGNNRDFSDSTAVIDNNNFENYIGDDEKILPDFINGQIVKLIGEVVAIQSTRGEILRFRALEIDPRYQLLVVKLEDGKSTEDYLQFYKKQVNLEAEVFRSSMYKKPEIIIKNISLLQEKLV